MGIHDVLGPFKCFNEFGQIHLIDFYKNLGLKNDKTLEQFIYINCSQEYYLSNKTDHA